MATTQMLPHGRDTENCKGLYISVAELGQEQNSLQLTLPDRICDRPTRAERSWPTTPLFYCSFGGRMVKVGRLSTFGQSARQNNFGELPF
jgi:hypothetical protein